MTTAKEPLRVVLATLPFRYFPNAWRRARNYARPPLGIAYLAAFLRAKATFPVDVRCLDLLAEGATSSEDVCARVLALHPHVVGISLLTATQPLGAWLAKALKEADPRIVVVCGGPHVTAMPDEQISGADALVLGEGEQSFLTYLEEAVLGGDRGPIAGIRRVLADGEVLDGGRERRIADLDTLPLPARDLLPNGAYFHSFPYRGVTGFTTLLTARGCPYACNFCANERLWGHTVRYRSVASVVEEIDAVVRDQGVNLVFFDDDTFTVNRARTEMLLAALRERKGLRWICHTRVDALDEALAREMAASGCVEIQLGVESGDPDVLRSTGKGVTLEEARRAVALAKRYGINVWATFVLGHELDTPRTLDATIQAAIDLDPTYASFIVLLPFPGTSVYETYRARGYLRTTDWGDFSWHGRPVFDTPSLSADDLVRARARANRAFYLRPVKLADLAWRTLGSGSSREMARNFWSWLSLVRHPISDRPGRHIARRRAPREP